jgi:guanylate kinase
MRQSPLFDYIIVNDDLPGAVVNFKSIIRAEIGRTERMATLVEQILEAQDDNSVGQADDVR